MLNAYFTNLENITISEINQAKNSLDIAVAWINFDLYGDVFRNLLARNVKVKMILNRDGINSKYEDDIRALRIAGAEILLQSYGGIMHHKFAVIDRQKCLFGSFNWTKNANIRNIEDLNICDEPHFVFTYLTEFYALWELSKTDIRSLRNPLICKQCKTPIINIMFMCQENDFQTKIDVIEKCECNSKIGFTDYFDISVYTNYLGSYQKFDDEIEYSLSIDNKAYYNEILSRRDFELSNYLSSIRFNRMRYQIIHAVGLKWWKWITKDDGEWVYKMIWKERNTEGYVEDYYDFESLMF